MVMIQNKVWDNGNNIANERGEVTFNMENDNKIKRVFGPSVEQQVTFRRKPFIEHWKQQQSRMTEESYWTYQLGIMYPNGKAKGILSEFPTVSKFLCASREDVTTVGCGINEFGRELVIYYNFLKKYWADHPRDGAERILVMYGDEEEYFQEYCEWKMYKYSVSLKGQQSMEKWWSEFKQQMEKAGCTRILEDGYEWPSYFDDFEGYDLHERKVKFVTMCILDATKGTGLYNIMNELKSNIWDMRKKITMLCEQPGIGRWFEVIIEMPRQGKEQEVQGSYCLEATPTEGLTNKIDDTAYVNTVQEAVTDDNNTMDYQVFLPTSTAGECQTDISGRMVTVPAKA